MPQITYNGTVEIQWQSCTHIDEGEECYYFEELFKKMDYYAEVYQGNVPNVDFTATQGVYYLFEEIVGEEESPEILIQDVLDEIYHNRVKSASFDLWICFIKGYRIWIKVDGQGKDLVLMTILLPEEY